MFKEKITSLLLSKNSYDK